MCTICRDECKKIFGLHFKSYRSALCIDPKPADILLAPLPDPQPPRPKERFDPVKFANKLQSLRSEKGFLQLELAKRINISVRALRSIEAGRSVPRVDTVAAIADALNIEISELIPLHKQSSGGAS